MLTIAAVGEFLLATFFTLVCLFMILIVLIQKPKGGGLAGAFGGAGGSDSVLGGKAGDILTWFTVGLFVLFLFLGTWLVYSTRSTHNQTITSEQPLPQVTPTPLDTAIPGSPPALPDSSDAGASTTTEPAQTPDTPDTADTPQTPKAPAEPSTTTEPNP